MRVFLSHCISSSSLRPPEFRDTADDEERLRSIGERLAREGFRPFEYRHFTRESRSEDLTEKLARQIALSDVVVLVCTRSVYTAPGWTVPELFYARALGKTILCYLLRGAPLEAFGDGAMRDRFNSLVHGYDYYPDEGSLLKKLQELRSSTTSLALTRTVFDLADDLANCASDAYWQRRGSIEEFLSLYHEAWKRGFRAAHLFLNDYRSPTPGWKLRRLSAWLDDHHMLLDGVDSHGRSQLNLFNADQGLATAATPVWPQSETILTAGLSANHELVVITMATGTRVGLHRVGRASGQWQSFYADLSRPPAVRSSVQRDCWFSGSELWRIQWDERRLEPAVLDAPTRDKFRRFSWWDSQADTAVDGRLECVFFTEKRDAWTMLPTHWESRCGDNPGNADLLLAWHAGQLFYGRAADSLPFRLGLPEVVELYDDRAARQGQQVPDFLKALKRESGFPEPILGCDRIEDESRLRLSWHASSRANVLKYHAFTLTLEQAQSFVAAFSRGFSLAPTLTELGETRV